MLQIAVESCLSRNLLQNDFFTYAKGDVVKVRLLGRALSRDLRFNVILSVCVDVISSSQRGEKLMKPEPGWEPKCGVGDVIDADSGCHVCVFSQPGLCVFAATVCQKYGYGLAWEHRVN